MESEVKEEQVAKKNFKTLPSGHLFWAMMVKYITLGEVDLLKLGNS